MPSAAPVFREAPSVWLIWKFSATVRSGKMPASSGAYPIPSRARSCVGSRVMSRPWRTIRPTRTVRRPMALSIVVVLPAPFRPTRQTASLAPTLRETPWRTCAGPRCVWTPSSSSALTTGASSDGLRPAGSAGLIGRPG
jgi:hypothetical protein